MKSQEKLKIANQYIAALITTDWDVFASFGLDESRMEQLKQIVSNGQHIQSAQVLYGLDSIAVSLNLLANPDRITPGLELISVLIFKNGEISAVNNYFSSVIPTTTVTTEKLKIGDQFLTALKNRDWSLMRSILTVNASWTLPGSSLLSGEALGVEAVINRAKQLRNFGVAVQLKHMLTGEAGVILSLHNTAMRGSLSLDEQVAIVCDISNGKISKITTHLNDVEGINTFFTDGII